MLKPLTAGKFGRKKQAQFAVAELENASSLDIF
jgi:hypothetical protein